MKEYLNNLIKQFKESTGYKGKDTISDEFVKEFSEWLKERELVGKTYTSFLDSMDLNYKDAYTAEVGKGRYDSVVKPYSTTLITNAIQFKDIDKERVVAGNVKVQGNTPLLITKENGKMNFEEISNYSIATYMTQNPYNPKEISRWENLHNSNNNDIIVGIYGDIHDKDIENKIAELKSLREKLICGTFVEDFTTEQDKYFYAIASKAPTTEQDKYFYAIASKTPKIEKVKSR